MRFKRDGFAASTWETDGNYNKIPGTEEQIELADVAADGYSPDGRYIQHIVSDAVVDRALRTAEVRWVIAEVWELDSSRPSMELYKTVKWQGRQPVKDVRYRGRLRHDV